MYVMKVVKMVIVMKAELTFRNCVELEAEIDVLDLVGHCVDCSQLAKS
jgi:hypothetical protein